MRSSVRHMGRVIADKNDYNAIKAICNNCSKRFESVCAITMHLSTTGGRHTVYFLEYGNYNRNTGIKEMNKIDKTR